MVLLGVIVVLVDVDALVLVDVDVLILGVNGNTYGGGVVTIGGNGCTDVPVGNDEIVGVCVHMHVHSQQHGFFVVLDGGGVPVVDVEELELDEELELVEELVKGVVPDVVGGNVVSGICINRSDG